MNHLLKTWPEYWEEVRKGNKNFEIRKNDRNFQIGDCLILQKFNPETGEFGDCITREVTYILSNSPFIPEGYICMSIK